jgi:methionine sulfoxide reductase heme-binding subunit
MRGMLVWYIARSSGLIAWALLAASVLWGLGLTTKVLRGRPRPAWLLDLHRYLGGLATIFVVVHVAGVLADTYVHFGLASVFVPFASSWRPVAVAWGVAGLYLLAAVELTSLLRARLPKRAWRAVHFASFPLFVTATIHALTAGTDTRTWAFELLATLVIVLVGWLTVVRVSRGSRSTRPSSSRQAGRRTPAFTARSQPAHGQFTSQDANMGP